MKGFLLLLAGISVTVWAEERSGKAVYETSLEKGMRLSEKALKNIEVATTSVSGGTDITLTGEPLVYFQDNVGVYRLRDGWFKLVKVQVVRKAKDLATLRSAELKAGDGVAIKGAGLLRVSEMDAFGGGE